MDNVFDTLARKIARNSDIKTLYQLRRLAESSEESQQRFLGFLMSAVRDIWEEQKL